MPVMSTIKHNLYYTCTIYTIHFHADTNGRPADFGISTTKKYDKINKETKKFNVVDPSPTIIP